MNELAHLKDICLRMQDIAASVGLGRFDRVTLMTDPDELWFMWEANKRIVVVELTATPEQIAAAVAHSTSADPVLN